MQMSPQFLIGHVDWGVNKCQILIFVEAFRFELENFYFFSSDYTNIFDLFVSIINFLN